MACNKNLVLYGQNKKGKSFNLFKMRHLRQFEMFLIEDVQIFFFFLNENGDTVDKFKNIP